MAATKDNIIVLPNDHLRQKSTRVGLITQDVKQLCRDMIDASIDWENSRNHEVTVGLAAVQIDKHLQVVIIREDFEDFKNKNFRVLINPEIIKYEADVYVDHEGCLSIPTIYGMVPRYRKVRVKARDASGKEIRFKAEGFLARLLQHEVDHLNGKLFIDHIKEDPDAFYRLSTEGKKLIKLDYDKDIKDNPELW